MGRLDLEDLLFASMFRRMTFMSYSFQVRFIADLINRPEYVPKMPNESELGNVFDSKYKDVQPYLHKVNAFSTLGGCFDVIDFDLHRQKT